MYTFTFLHTHTHTLSLSPPPPQFPSAQGASYQTLQSNLSACAAALNVSGSEVMTAAKSTPEHQAEASSKFAKTFSEMLTAGLTLAGASKVSESPQSMWYGNETLWNRIWTAGMQCWGTCEPSLCRRPSYSWLPRPSRLTPMHPM